MEAIGMKILSTPSSMFRRDIQPSKRLCRNLFGPVDHEEVTAQLDFELQKDLTEKTKEWSFDFAEGTPITGGPFAWEKVEEIKKTDVKRQSETPQAIINEERRVPELHPEKSDPENDVFLAPSTVEVAKSISTRSKAAEKSSLNATAQSIQPVVDRKRKRPCKTITDFMKQKKKRRVSYSSVEKNNKTDLPTSTGRCVKDDLVLRNTAKKVRVSEC